MNSALTIGLSGILVKDLVCKFTSVFEEKIMEKEPGRALSRWMNPLHLKSKRLRSNKFGARVVLKYLLWAFIAFLVVTAGAFAYYSRDLPTPGKIATRYVPQSTQIYDRNGKLLYEIHGSQNRTVIPLENIPKSVQQATLAAEDANFYHEYGFDLRGILRSALIDVFSTHSLSNGGSTITQQFVKNALLSPEKSFTRKIKELILSIEVEASYTKDQILAFYLNEIPFGSNAYGIQTAAKTFFSKDAKDLDLAESATLAAMLNAPTHYSPYGSHKDELISRQHWVLDRMVDLGMVSKDDADKAKSETLSFANQNNGIQAPHFVMYVKELLTEKYGEQLVEEGGLKVTTTLDLDMQNKAEKAITDNEKKYQADGASNAALVAMDPKTGQVLAMVGSQDYFDTANSGNFNVATASRQPGSSFKPIVYATAFKNKFDPAFTLWDVPTTFGDYTPQNFNGKFNGPVSMRFALQNSLNVPAVKTLALVGVDKAIQTAHDMGITTLNDGADHYGLSLVLGGGEVKPIDMASAYSTFANQGVTRDQVTVLKVEDNSGKVLEEYNDNRGKHESLDPQIAYEMSNVLSDNNSRATVFGLRSPLYFSDRPVAAKTGTTSLFRDAWTVGYTPSLTTAVWVGNNDNHPMKSGTDGVVVAAPIFHSFMASALAGTSVEQFNRPAEIKDITVDRFSNKLPTDSSPETITDIFTSWQVPKDQDNIHVKVKINKLNGLLATSFTPADLVTEQTYTNLHSEKPSDPNWENPVMAYAQAHDITVSNPPTQQDTLYTESSRPTVSITSPTAGQSVVGSFTIQVATTGSISVSKIEAFIDSQSLGTKTSAPYSFPASTSGLAVGSHQIQVIATDTNGATVTTSMTLSVAADSTPPAEVKSLSVTQQSSTSATLSWVNPSSPDLTKVHVYVSSIAGSIGTMNTEVAAVANSSGGVTIPGLVTGTPYYFTLKTTDISGNESSGAPTVSITLH